jgi:hypothetical protein
MTLTSAWAPQATASKELNIALERVEKACSISLANALI